MRDNNPDQAAVDIGTAKLGALLAAKGLTPDQVATVMSDQVLPALADAARLVENGVDIDDLKFEIRHADRPGPDEDSRGWPPLPG